MDPVVSDINPGEIWEDVYPRARPHGDRRFLVITAVKKNAVHAMTFYRSQPTKIRTTVIGKRRLLTDPTAPYRRVV